MIEMFIAGGEVFTGVVYILIGLVFINQARYNHEKHRYTFRLGVALLFIVGGMEELADSAFTEGSSPTAVATQFVLTLMQVITCTLALMYVWKARLITEDFAKKI